LNDNDTLKSVKPWVTFAGVVLVVAVLYWAQAVLVPFALAILLTFVLTPPVNWLQRWVGRVPAVLLVVTLALAMLAHLIDDLPIVMEITAARMQAVELVSLVRDRKFSVVCFADLPPSSSSKTRYLVRRLRSTLPELRIVVGRWAPSVRADESSQTLLDAGANHVASLLIDSRNYLEGLLEMPRLPVPDAAGLTELPPSIGSGSA
jgi:hypothetical protein